MNTLNMSSKCQLCNSDLPGMQGSHKERNHYVQYNYDYYEYVVGKTMITFFNNGYGRYSEYGILHPVQISIDGIYCLQNTINLI